nr:ABC transporter substrate-binding protein [Kineococcus aurantiacus]
MFVVGLVSEGLITQDGKGGLVPRLATAWEVSGDDLTWTITLREGATFNDGTAVTADDVVATFTTITGADSLSPGASAFKDVLATVAPGPGPGTVEFHLARPYSDFPVLLTGSNTTILPAGTSEQADWKADPVGAGQFLLTEYTPGQGVRFTKNPRYWDAGNVLLDELHVKFYADAQAQLLAFQAGEVDQVAADPTVLRTLGAEVKQSAPGYTKFDGIFLDVTVAPFTDVRVRQAIAWALDRDAIVATVYGRNATVANDALYFPDYAVQPGGLTQRRADTAKVAELLGGRRVSFTITTVDTLQTLAEVVQQQLNATGSFDVQLSVLPSAQYYADGADTPWLSAPATITNWARRLPSQYVSQLFATGAAWNASKYSNPQLEQLSAQYDATTDPGQRQDLADRIAAIEWNDVAVVVPAFASSRLVLAQDVEADFASGQDFSGGFDFRHVRLS